MKKILILIGFLLVQNLVHTQSYGTNILDMKDRAATINRLLEDKILKLSP